ncbi:flagellar biosynthetic protein FliR [Gorillibacterium sp. sgz5001074]|uniref:flagellar biosynthetic protein FliR n=1 Tax=Gorillibacterium sp. sgz5001074 TaxID=3446695 RepID=UPI003F67755F
METLLLSLSGFLLTFCRIGSFFVVAPVISSRNVPGSFKVGLAFFVSLLTFSGMGLQPVPLDGLYIIAVIKEILVGLLLGFIGYMFFTVVQVSGSFIDMQIGLSMANIIDPMTGVSSPIIGNLKFMVATLLFLSFNGHHFLLQAIMDSYKWIPLQNEAFVNMYNGAISDFLVRTFTDTFGIAFKMAAPLVAALFLTDLGLGILARTAPQFNIFVIGVPLKLLVGLLLLAMLLPSMLFLFQDLFSALFTAMEKAIAIMAGQQT